ncbi:MAG TPA: DUF2835 domain-containing protein [Cellvibrionaceae bacterium]
MNTITMSLAIDREQLLRWYSGRVQQVLAHDDRGRRVRFPVSVLQPFVTREGIYGRFRILFDSENKFQGIEKID